MCRYTWSSTAPHERIETERGDRQTRGVGRARLAAAACARTRQENKRDGRACCCESEKNKNTPTLFPDPPPILRHELDDCINGAAGDCIAVAATMVILLLQEAALPRHQQLLLLHLLPGSTRAVELWRSFTPVLVPTTTRSSYTRRHHRSYLHCFIYCSSSSFLPSLTPWWQKRS